MVVVCFISIVFKITKFFAVLLYWNLFGTGTITYDEFIVKVLPPEFVHGGGGIMDFESDDPDYKGAVTKKEQLFALKKQIRRQLLTKAKNMREMFRRMGGAGDGEVDEYEFKTALRNANIGIGHENIMGLLFKEIDADHSGHIDFKEFAANLSHEEKEEGNFFVGGGRSKNRFIPQGKKKKKQGPILIFQTCIFCFHCTWMCVHCTCIFHLHCRQCTHFF